MFDVGFGELLIFGLIGLLVLGPERLPKVARTFGQYSRKARHAWNQMRNELEKEIDASDIKQTIKTTRESLDGVKKATIDETRSTFKSANDSIKEGTDTIKQTLDEISNTPKDDKPE